VTSSAGLHVLASATTASAIALVVYRLAPPPKKLSSRVRPYLAPSLSLATTVDRGMFGQVFGPILTHAAELVGRTIDRAGNEMTLMRLRQANWHPDHDEREMVMAFRLAQLRAVAVGAGLGLLAGVVLGLTPTMRVVLVVLGLMVGATRLKGAVETAIQARRDVMRIEIYTVNQLLAMRVRAGGGVVHAVQAIVDRGRGEVITELAQALRLQRAGWRAAEAFRRIAEMTPEPYCSRTYRLLASAEERGTDLASGLLALSEDVRETRRESMKRSATKRRAAMLVPTIAILAPVLILFVAAPLPYLITGWQ